MGVSHDGQVVFAGGMSRGSANRIRANVKALGANGAQFEIEKLKGWPEYFKGFAFDGKETVYGSTSGYRLIKLTSAGRVISQTPIF